jgi:hypothetical protein
VLFSLTNGGGGTEISNPIIEIVNRSFAENQSESFEVCAQKTVEVLFVKSNLLEEEKLPIAAELRPLTILLSMMILSKKIWMR